MYPTPPKKVEEREAITLELDGQKIFGILHKPVAATKTPAVLICHGLGGNKTGKNRVYVELARMLTEKGMTVFRFDFRGCGDSEGEFAEVTIEHHVADALLAMEFLKNQPLVDERRLGIFGRSLGGAVTTLTAQRSQNIKSLALWAAIYNGDQWRNEWVLLSANKMDAQNMEIKTRINGQKTSLEFFEGLFSLELEKSLADLKEVALLHLHGEKDTLVTTYHAECYEKAREQAIANSTFIRLPNGDHDFSDPEDQAFALLKTVEWFQQTL